MPGGSSAPKSGKDLEDAVCRLATELKLEVRRGVVAARRLWGAKRTIDIVLRHRDGGKTLGIECKFQAVAGSAEEKIPATIHDIGAWPIPGLVVFDGEGFTENMKSYLVSSGRAVEFHDLEDWLRLFFGLPLG